MSIRLRRKFVLLGFSASCIVLAATPVPAQSDDSTITAVSGTVTGNVQGVGFRAMIQKQAIEYNLTGLTENRSDNSVRFVLQGAKDRVDKALNAMRRGTKKSSNVAVQVTPVSVDEGLKTFTIVGWTSDSRSILRPYDLTFDLRPDNSTVDKKEAKAVWLEICRKTVKGEDVGKCDKDGD